MAGSKGVTNGLKDLAMAVAKSAPILAGVLGSPFASVGLSLLGSIFGIHTKDAEDLLTKIHGDPEAAAKMAKLEFEHSEALAKLANESYATEVQDRIDARQYGEQYKEFMKKLAIWVTVGFFAALCLLFVPGDIGQQNMQLLSMLVGMLASKWQTIIDFFYGSSRHNSQGATTK
jgi:hypothetical protein